jgi:hypothetical protein
MSLSYQPLNTVLVQDPRVIVNNQRDYAILKGGSQSTYKQWTSTSISNSSIQFSCPPPSGGVFVDRKIMMYLPVKITMTGVVANIGDTLLYSGYDAPRAFPLSGIIDTLSATINNQSVSINLADLIHTLQHFNSDVKLKNGGYSLTPNYPDQSQQYEDLGGSTRNPLADFSSGLEETVMQRGGFPFSIVSNPVSTVVNQTVTAVVEFAITEQLLLPPFYFGSGNGSALFNVTSMDFNFTFINNAANRMWSHLYGAGILGTNPVTSSSVSFGGTTGTSFNSYLPGGTLPLLLIEYITPQETQVLSPNMSISYPYFDIQRYPTQLSSMPAGPNQRTDPSNNIQLSSIPRRLYIFVRDSNQNLYNNMSLTDSYCPITNVSIQFMNKNGLLASASPMQLYMMSVKNGLNMSWTQWSGQANGPQDSLLATSGGPICVEFATDIGLDSLHAPGKLGQYMLQVQVTYKNTSNRTISPVLYLAPVLEGTFTIPSLGRSLINIGVITSQDILDAQSKPGISYSDIEDVHGGNFFTGIKDFFSKHVLPQLKTFVDNKGISKTLGMIPHPLAQTASKVAQTFGYGEGEGGVMAGEGEGGVLLGGRQMSRAQLQRRLKNY